MFVVCYLRSLTKLMQVELNLSEEAYYAFDGRVVIEKKFPIAPIEYISVPITSNIFLSMAFHVGDAACVLFLPSHFHKDVEL